MARSRSSVPPEKAWKLGRGSTVPVTAVWAGAAGCLLNTAIDVTPTGTIVLGGLTAGLTGFTALGSWAKGHEERQRGLPGMNVWQGAYLTACACASGTWVTWAASTLPWGPFTAAAWAGGTLAAWLLYPWYRYSRRHALAAEHADRYAQPAQDTPERERTAWEQVFTRRRMGGITELTCDPWEEGAGYTLRLRLPDDGSITFNRLLQETAALEAAKGDVRTGSVRFEHIRGRAGEVLMHVTTRDVLAENFPLPDEHGALTINEPFTIAYYEDGKPVLILVRQNAILIAGMRGSGKSVLLHVLLSYLLRCVDAVVWMSDMGGGATARPWLRPFLEKRPGADRPVIDWVATTPQETELQQAAAMAIIDGRSARCNGKVIPSTDEPALIYIMEEVADLFSVAPKSAQASIRIKKKGRKAAVDEVQAVQRGTVPNTGGGESKSQFDSIIGLRMASKGETQHVFPDDYSTIDLSRLEFDGSLYAKIKGGHKRPMAAKGVFVDDSDPEVIARLALLRTPLRPGLDEKSIQDIRRAMGDVYDTRWSYDRIRHLFDDEGPAPAPQPISTPRTDPPAGGIGRTAAKLGLPPSRILGDMGIGQAPAGPVSPAGEKLARELEEFLRTQAAPAPAPSEPSAASAQPDADEDTTDPRRAVVMRIVAEAGPKGISPTPICKKVAELGYDEPHRATVTRWLDVEPTVFKPTGYSNYAIRPDAQ